MSDSENERAFLRAFIGSRRWQFAKTFAKFAPHWYTIRNWKPDDVGEFDAVVRIIAKYGEDRLWHGKKWRYLDLDGWAGKGITIVNRVPL